MSKDDQPTGFDGIGRRIDSMPISKEAERPPDISSVPKAAEATATTAEKNDSVSIANTSSEKSGSTRPTIYIGRIMLCIAALIIIIFAMQSGSGTQSGKQPSRSDLRAAIEANKARISQYESELQSLRLRIDLARIEIDSLKNRIRNDQSFGFDASFSIQRHNSLVNQYNMNLREYDDIYSRYSELLSRTNTLVNDYNSRRR